MGYLSGYDDDMGTVLAHVRAERFRQEDLRKSGKFSHTCATAGANNDRCNTILGEEVGEVARAILENDIPGLRAELVQVAAVAVAWVERLDAEALAAQKRWDAAMAKPFAAPVFIKSATVALREAGEAVPLATRAEVEALRAGCVVDDPDASKEVTDPAERAKIVHVWQTRVPAAELDAALQPFQGPTGDLSKVPPREERHGIDARNGEKHGPDGSGERGPCDPGCPKCLAELTRLVEAAERQATPERYAALGDSYDFIESMIEERTAANPQFPEMLAEAVKRRGRVHQLARDAAKVDFVTPPPPPPASLVHWSPQPGREESEAMCDPTMAAPPASAAIAEVNCPACLSLAAKIGAQASRDLQRMAIEPGSHRATAFADVAAERERQVTKGYNEEHDDSHGNGSIAAAAIAFTAAALGDGKLADAMYPFGLGFVTKRDDSPRSLLVKAAALLIAEIERRDRAAEAFNEEHDMADGESSSADTGGGEG